MGVDIVLRWKGREVLRDILNGCGPINLKLLASLSKLGLGFSEFLEFLLGELVKPYS